MFKALSSEEKEPYEEMARKDKERYKKEMADYVPPSDDDDDDDSEDNKKSKKKKKDPNAPKRGKSSFMFFSSEWRSNSPKKPCGWRHAGGSARVIQPRASRYVAIRTAISRSLRFVTVVSSTWTESLKLISATGSVPDGSAAAASVSNRSSMPSRTCLRKR